MTLTLQNGHPHLNYLIALDMADCADVSEWLYRIRKGKTRFFPCVFSGFIDVWVDKTIHYLLCGYSEGDHFDTYFKEIRRLPRNQISWMNEALEISIDCDRNSVSVSL